LLLEELVVHAVWARSKALIVGSSQFVIVVVVQCIAVAKGTGNGYPQARGVHRKQVCSVTQGSRKRLDQVRAGLDELRIVLVDFEHAGTKLGKYITP
jgi:hypothetical protein